MYQGEAFAVVFEVRVGAIVCLLLIWIYADYVLKKGQQKDRPLAERPLVSR
jgi:hypothetical protein